MTGKESNDLTVVIDARFFLGLFAPTEGEWAHGGAEMQMYYLANALLETPGVTVVLLGEEPEPNFNDKGFVYRRVTPDVARGIPFLSRYINRSRAKRVWKAIFGPTVFFQTQYEPVNLTQYAKKRGIRIVRLINGDSLVDESNPMGERAQREVDIRIELADALIAQNEYQSECLKKYYGKESVVLDSFVDSDMGEIDVRKSREILWVGRCSPEKRPELVAEVAAALPQYNFKVIASTENSDPSYAIEVTDILAKEPNVSVMPGVSSERAKHELAQAAIVLNTSVTEGMPNTLIEAALSATPTIAFEVNPEGVLTEENGGHSSSGSLDDFIQTIDTWMSDIDLRKKMGMRAKAWACRKWDNERTLDGYLDLFYQVLCMHDE